MTYENILRLEMSRKMERQIRESECTVKQLLAGKTVTVFMLRIGYGCILFQQLSKAYHSYSHGACLDYMLPGVQVTAGLGIFLCSSHLCDNEDCDSLL